MDKKQNVSMMVLIVSALALIYGIYMYIQKERYKQEDYALYGNPKEIDERIKSDMIVASAGLMNRCQDILSGDTQWLQNYPSQGMHARNIAQFLAPYFQQQGYYVKQAEE